MRAYHFHNNKLRDGRELPAIGEKLVHDGPLVMCMSGLHASKHPFDALRYAPGPYLDIVELGGAILVGNDKVVALERTRIAMINATELLREFARKCALDVVHLWNAPEVVVRYLKTGDVSIRAAARATAWAAEDATRDAARDAARAAARAAWAAWATSAAEAAEAAAWAARDAASAARAAAWAKQRSRFQRMVDNAFREKSNENSDR